MHPAAPLVAAKLVVLLLLCQHASGDVYMHNPRGSNDKLNEASNTRNDDNRLFNSQNNANGGYQVGDACVPNCQTNGDGNYDKTKDGAGEGVMYYYQNSVLAIEWTAQHACGVGNPNTICTFILQYMCSDGTPETSGIRDGTTPNRIPEATQDDATVREAEDPPGKKKYGMHENYEYYRRCKYRQRNRGLFIADDPNNRIRNQDAQGKGNADLTRQNNNRETYGLECQEERDYYPYWHWSPWRDIAILTTDTSRCGYYKKESQNRKPRYECKLDPTSLPANTLVANQEADCKRQGGTWTLMPAWDIDPPECAEASMQRDNHLGNTFLGQPASYNWTIPKDIASDACVLRLRYNISTTDYPKGNDWDITSDSNGGASPVSTNPNKDFLKFNTQAGLNNKLVTTPDSKLQLAVNTAQFGRVFQDRSHVFRVVKRDTQPKHQWSSGSLPGGSTRIVNLNVRGRRGNIVQVYPSVEYDFVPSPNTMYRGDWLHIQWTGSDANNRGNAGEGTAGTDRSNIVQLVSQGGNTPAAYDKNPLFTTSGGSPDLEKIAFFAFLGQTNCNPTPTAQNSPDNCFKLNRAPAYIDGGLVKLQSTGTYKYMSTRNNNFSNRSQKGSLLVKFGLSLGGAIGLAIGLVIGLCLLSGIGLLGLFARRNPNEPWTQKKFVKKLFRVPDPAEEAAQDHGILYLEKNQQLFVVFLFMNLIMFAWGFLQHAQYIIQYGNVWFPLAKCGGTALNLDFSLIIIPLLRNFNSYIRGSPVGKFIDTDMNIEFHKLIAWSILFHSVVHIVAHIIDFVWFHQRKPCRYNCLTGFWGWKWGDMLLTIPGVTGFLITIMMVVMYVFALERNRRRDRKFSWFGGRLKFGFFDVFWYTHQMWIFCFLLMWLHAPRFYIWSFYPIILFLFEKGIEYYRLRQPVEVVAVVLEKQSVVKLVLHKPGFHYQSGQYLRLKVPQLSPFQTHPFTISSAPEEDFLTVHIRASRGNDWTTALKDLFPFSKDGAPPQEIRYRDNPNAPGPAPVIKVDGPYSAASEEYVNHRFVVLVGAGIGITPMASIIKSVMLRHTRGSIRGNGLLKVPEKVYFYWIVNNLEDFEWFALLMNSIKQSEMSKLVEFHTYCTGEMDLVKYESSQGKRPWDVQFTGRPQWAKIIPELKKRHQGTKEDPATLGIFLCGPPAIGSAIEPVARKHSDETIKITFQKENF